MILGRTSPEPWVGSPVELSGLHASGLLNLIGIGMRSLFLIALLTAVMFLEREVFKGKWLRLVVWRVFLGLSLFWYLFPSVGKEQLPLNAYSE